MCVSVCVFLLLYCNKSGYYKEFQNVKTLEDKVRKSLKWTMDYLIILSICFNTDLVLVNVSGSLT